jgi:DNA-binding NarL/FixJ family response regulator
VHDAVDAGAVGYLLTRRITQAPQDQLSDREREVLGLVADGLANSRSPAISASASAPSRPT